MTNQPDGAEPQATPAMGDALAPADGTASAEELLAKAPTSIKPPRAKTPTALWVVVGVAAVAISFAGGLLTGRATAPEPSFTRGQMMVGPGGPDGPGGPVLRDGPGGGPGGQAFRGQSGQVVAVSADSITLQLDDGSEVSFKVDQDTQVTDIQTLDVTVLQEGDQIMVMAEPDGSDSGGTARAITRGGGDMAFPMVGRRIG
ncbi:MAG: hypothetical protein FWG16_04535 [Micrococcales bacterium]|nr:hypothetical protein [Micrococcales bacterium]